MRAVVLVLAVVVAAGLACSNSSKSGGATNPPIETGVDAPVPLKDAPCVGRSFAISRPVEGVPGGVQSTFTLNSSSVHQAATPTGPSSLLAQYDGGKLELDWLGAVDDGKDVAVVGGLLVVPADNPAPMGSFCVRAGTVWHKAATGGKIEFVVTEGDCPTPPPGDAGVDDAGDAGDSGDAGDAAAPGTIVMKGCILFGGA